LSLATVLAWAVYGEGLFFLTGWLLDRRVEIWTQKMIRVPCWSYCVKGTVKQK
jgi:hypothetical protein